MQQSLGLIPDKHTLVAGKHEAVAAVETQT